MSEVFPYPAGTVFVDALFAAVRYRGGQARRVGARHGHMWCHLWSENLEALHLMAHLIGMRRAWFQDKPGFPHYDLVPSRRKHAVSLGATEKDLAEWLRERKRELTIKGTKNAKEVTP